MDCARLYAERPSLSSRIIIRTRGKFNIAPEKCWKTAFLSGWPISNGYDNLRRCTSFSSLFSETPPMCHISAPFAAQDVWQLYQRQTTMEEWASWVNITPSLVSHLAVLVPHLDRCLKMSVERTFRGRCPEFRGVGHSNKFLLVMVSKLLFWGVVSVSQESFNMWFLGKIDRWFPNWLELGICMMSVGVTPRRIFFMFLPCQGNNLLCRFVLACFLKCVFSFQL